MKVRREERDKGKGADQDTAGIKATVTAPDLDAMGFWDSLQG